MNKKRAYHILYRALPNMLVCLLYTSLPQKDIAAPAGGDEQAVVPPHPQAAAGGQPHLVKGGGVHKGEGDAPPARGEAVTERLEEGEADPVVVGHCRVTGEAVSYTHLHHPSPAAPQRPRRGRLPPLRALQPRLPRQLPGGGPGGGDKLPVSDQPEKGGVDPGGGGAGEGEPPPLGV